MTYHRRGLGSGIETRPTAKTTTPNLVPDMRFLALPNPASPGFTLAPNAMTRLVGDILSTPQSLVTPECANYSAQYKVLPRTGVIKAGTPIVASRKISWNPSVVGSDFPKSWVTLRVRGNGAPGRGTMDGDADSVRQKMDADTRDCGATAAQAAVTETRATISKILAAGREGGESPGALDALRQWGTGPESYSEMLARWQSNAGKADAWLKTTVARRAAGFVPTSTVWLTDATKMFLVGYTLIAPNEGILYVGVVSSHDVDSVKLQDYLKLLLKTPKSVTGSTITAYAEVPKIPAVAAGAPGVIVATAPMENETSYQARIGPQYSVHTARSVANSAIVALWTDLHTLVQGGIFGGLAITPALGLPGEGAVSLALTTLNTMPSLAELPPAVASATSSLLAEAEAAKEMPPADGDKAIADVLSRLAKTQGAISSDLSTKIQRLSAGVAFFPAAHAAVTAASGVSAGIRNQVKDAIAKYEAKPSVTSLTPGERGAIHCYLLNAGQNAIGKAVAKKEPIYDAIRAYSPESFAAAIAAAIAACESARAQVDVAFGGTKAKIEEIRKQIALDWYMRDFHGQPVWVWGAGGALLLVGGAVAIRALRKKTPAALPVK